MSNSGSEKIKEFRHGSTLDNNSADVLNRKFLNELLKYNNLNTVFAVATGFEKNVVVSNASSLRFRFPTRNKMIVMNIFPHLHKQPPQYRRTTSGA